MREKIETAEKHQVKEALLLCAKQLAETRNGVDNNTVGLKERIEKKHINFPIFFVSIDVFMLRRARQICENPSISTLPILALKSAQNSKIIILTTVFLCVDHVM